MKRWRSPSASRRTVHAELNGGGCPLSRAEREILAQLENESRAPGVAVADDNDTNNNKSRARGPR